MLRAVLKTLSLAALLILPLGAHAFETDARAAYVFDQTTGTVILDKNADEPLPPASMSKLMTLLMTFEAIRDGRLSLEEKLPVSAKAMAYGGSTMFLNTRDRVSVEDLIRGIIVLSGNDACAVLAEALSFDGTEETFARMMTDRARELGMMNSNFANSNGWPHPEHRMSMRDLGILADRLITDFPTFYPLFAQQVFEFDGRAPANTQNRNPLLGLGIGADGLKTGRTKEAGFGLVGSAKLNDRRVIFVITGLETARARAVEAERIVTWAFRQFSQKELTKADTVLAQADVWMGNSPSVGLVSPEDLSVLIPLQGAEDAKTEIVYEAPLAAPITQGQHLADLVVTAPGVPETRFPLVAATAVDRGGFSARMRTAARVLLRMIDGSLDGAT